ncbi:hypothetical protein ACFYXM_24230 [Streptomyces sp. NPDC002476]|uniref:hypothetical protein n=1 Tax=Streptomyces sp. NPDC002476 TaxID=3364648 RepID=UPI0036BDBC51
MTAVDAAMPGASEAERREATATQLHQDVTARAWAKAYRWEQVRARQAVAAQACAEAAAEQSAGDVPAAPMAPVVLPAAPRPVAVPDPVDGDDQEQVRTWRVRGMKDHSVVFDNIDQYGETSAGVQPPAGRRGAAPGGHAPLGHTT